MRSCASPGESGKGTVTYYRAPADPSGRYALISAWSVCDLPISFPPRIVQADLDRVLSRRRVGIERDSVRVDDHLTRSPRGRGLGAVPGLVVLLPPQEAVALCVVHAAQHVGEHLVAPRHGFARLPVEGQVHGTAGLHAPLLQVVGGGDAHVARRGGSAGPGTNG